MSDLEIKYGMFIYSYKYEIFFGYLELDRINDYIKLCVMHFELISENKYYLNINIP